MILFVTIVGLSGATVGTATANQPPERNCREYIEVPVDQSCRWHVLSDDLQDDFVDPDGDPMLCGAMPFRGDGLQAMPIDSLCVDSHWAYPEATCQSVVYPYDDLPPTVGMSQGYAVVDIGGGGEDWLEFDVQELCGIRFSDNCTPTNAIQHGTVGITQTWSEETMTGGPGWFVSTVNGEPAGIAATWHQVWINPAESTAERVYYLTYGVHDAYGNSRERTCVIDVQRLITPTP